ncbi:MAG: hypothetical protein DRI71_03200 [Bacteroidetes bacterium]|nr:MAG: hypothetical protein DRI71_03200 [Bacteroidota bacterium]
MLRALTIILISFSTVAYGQLTNFKEIWKDHTFKGDELFDHGLYEQAITSYKKELEVKNNNIHATARIAESYKILGQYTVSKGYYDILSHTGKLDSIQHQENYADVLLSSGHLEKALEYYRIVLTSQPDNLVVRNKIMGILSWDEFYKNEEYINIQAVPFNSKYSEYGLRPFRDGLSFTSSRVSDLIIQHNYLRGVEGLTDVFVLKYDGDKANNAKVLELEGYKRKNDGPLSGANDLFVISRTISDNSAGESTLGLFFYESDSIGNLTYEYAFPHNSSSHTITHASFNNSGDSLFYSSDMSGGFGGMDIYYSVYRDNVWTAPINLGEPINTRKNEIYPFNDNGTFYFSSDGHAGLGGYDTYQLVLEKREKIILNLGYPINSSWDDFSIYIEGDHGFISSNDPKGKGEDDIYEFQLLPRPKVIDSVQVNLSILDNLNDYPVDSASIIIIHEQDTAYYISNGNGVLIDKFMPGAYTVKVEKTPYVNYSFVIHVEEGDNVKQMVRLEPAIALHTVSPDSIMFKFGEYSLLKMAEEELDDIVQTLNDYPELQLKISAHTDSRGSHEFNLWLSERRSEVAATYIVSQGIDSARVHEKGYGETRLLNNCRDGIRCSAKLHDVNRRIEFDFKRKEDSE